MVAFLKSLDDIQVDAIRKGTAMVLECRKQKRYDNLVMDAAAKLLRVVPEVRVM